MNEIISDAPLRCPIRFPLRCGQAREAGLSYSHDRQPAFAG